ncbi:hypothetical protein D3C72_1696720 [compost metagenome]
MGDKPSIVVMLCPATAATGNWQERTATPSRCTVQAPHRPMPQPNLVPVSFKWSRNTHNKGMEGDVSASSRRSPFTVNSIIVRLQESGPSLCRPGDRLLEAL